jgi:hypothetical protein
LRNFVGEMLFGIQASQDVKLSNIARSLQEDISLIKTEDRLSRNLHAEELETYLRTDCCGSAWKDAVDLGLFTIAIAFVTTKGGEVVMREGDDLFFAPGVRFGEVDLVGPGLAQHYRARLHGLTTSRTPCCLMAIGIC